MSFLKWVYDVQVRLEHQGLHRHVVDESRHVLQHFLTRVQAWEVHSGWVVAVHFTVSTMERAFRANDIKELEAQFTQDERDSVFCRAQLAMALWPAWAHQHQYVQGTAARVQAEVAVKAKPVVAARPLVLPPAQYVTASPAFFPPVGVAQLRLRTPKKSGSGAY
jgi:hypothetical protein